MYLTTYQNPCADCGEVLRKDLTFRTQPVEVFVWRSLWQEVAECEGFLFYKMSTCVCVKDLPIRPKHLLRVPDDLPAMSL